MKSFLLFLHWTYFKDLRILNFENIYQNEVGKFVYICPKDFLVNHLEKCLPEQTKYIHIILETQTFIIPFNIEQIFKNSQYPFKALFPF